MRIILLVLIQAILLLTLIDAKCERKNLKDIKTYKIDLNLHPSIRFNQVTTDFKEEILALFDSEK